MIIYNLIRIYFDPTPDKNLICFDPHAAPLLYIMNNEGLDQLTRPRKTSLSIMSTSKGKGERTLHRSI